MDQQRRDDSRDRMLLIQAMINLARDTLPIGYGKEQEEVIKRLEMELNQALVTCHQYINLRERMK